MTRPAAPFDPTPFADLPAALVEEVLGRTSDVAGEILHSFRSAESERAALRAALERSGLVIAESSLGRPPLPTTCAVDGSYAVERLLTADLAVAAAVAVEGLAPPSGRRHPDMPRHKSFIAAEPRLGETATVLRAIMLGEELRLGGNAPHDLVLFDGTLASSVIHFNLALNKAPEAPQLRGSREFMEHCPAYLDAYLAVLRSGRPDKHYAALPRYSTRREVGEYLDWPEDSDDRGMLTMLLEPGELTRPLALGEPRDGRGNPVRRLDVGGFPSETRRRARELSDGIESALDEIRVFHYRPRSWSPALRIEVSRGVASDPRRLATVVRGIKHQTAAPSMLEPYPIHLADRTVRALARAIPAFRQVTTQRISEGYEGDVGEVFFAMHGYRSETGDIAMADDATANDAAANEDDAGDFEELVNDAEQLGVVGSPSSTTELAFDILGAAAARKLVGELALLPFTQDGVPHYALGQITEVELRNVWHEDPTMRSLIRRRGHVDAVSGSQDTHLGQMAVSAVFRGSGAAGFEPGILGTVPATGTPIRLVTGPVLDGLLRPYRDQLFYLGHVHGSEPRLPLWFKHFGTGPDGAGEAYHLGIFGKTGSGKSVLAKMILLAYAQYPEMALLVIDPQGEFARDMGEDAPDGGFALPVGNVVRKLGKPKFVIGVRNLVLDRWELFRDILFESEFFEHLTIPKGENREQACKTLVDRLRRDNVELKDLHARASFDKAWDLLRNKRVQAKFYRTPDPRARFNDAVNEADSSEFYAQYWKPVAELFREDRKGAGTVGAALKWLLDPDAANRRVLVVDLSNGKDGRIPGGEAGELFWNDDVQSLVVKRLLDGISREAENFYRERRSLNTLIVIDEAHRFADRDIPREDETALGLRSMLIDAARTTRKYGLGWLFISQTLSSLHAEILQQLRISFFGFGLGLGQEFLSLRQLVGSSGAALDLHQRFRDPHSAFDAKSRQYSFMTIGPVSPLSFSGSPLFLNTFNTVEAFLAANGLGD